MKKAAEFAKKSTGVESLPGGSNAGSMDWFKQSFLLC